MSWTSFAVLRYYHKNHPEDPLWAERPAVNSGQPCETSLGDLLKIVSDADARVGLNRGQEAALRAMRERECERACDAGTVKPRLWVDVTAGDAPSAPPASPGKWLLAAVAALVVLGLILRDS